MTSQRKTLIALAVAAGTAASGEVLAHANVAAKDGYITADGRSYQEGTSAELSLNLSHACPIPAGVTANSDNWGTVIATVLFPNGPGDEVYDLQLDPKTLAVLSKEPSKKSLASVLYTTDGKGNNYAGNPLMGTKPSRDGDWLQIVPKRGEVPQFYSYGAKNQDVRSIHWHGGKVPDSFYEDLEFRTSFPKFKPDSCATKVRVYLPAIQYCSNNLSFTAMPDVKVMSDDPWLWAPVPGVFDTVAAPGYAPYIDIDRDLKNNPLPKGCRYSGKYGKYDGKDDQDGRNKPGLTDQVIGVYPSADAIEHFLMHMGNGAGGGDHTGGGTTCGPNQHQMPDGSCMDN